MMTSEEVQRLADEYRTQLTQLGLTQGQAAELLGVSPRTSAAYATAEYQIPKSVRNFLELLVTMKYRNETFIRQWMKAKIGEAQLIPLRKHK